MEEFFEKRKALFDCLDDASKELKGTSLDQSKRKTIKAYALSKTSSGGTIMLYRNSEDVPYNSNVNKSLAYLQGKESIFKKPELPIGRCLRPSRAPDYQIHPHRWKKYTLEEMDISDNSNTTAAFAFLNEMDRRKTNVSDEDKADSGKCKIEFKRSSQIKRNIKEIDSHNMPDSELDLPKFKGQKLIMPEYFVGQTTLKKKKKPINRDNHAAGSLKLSHLDEGEDCDN